MWLFILLAVVTALLTAHKSYWGIMEKVEYSPLFSKADFSVTTKLVRIVSILIAIIAFMVVILVGMAIA